MATAISMMGPSHSDRGAYSRGVPTDLLFGVRHIGPGPALFPEPLVIAARFKGDLMRVGEYFAQSAEAATWLGWSVAIKDGCQALTAVAQQLGGHGVFEAL